MCDQRLAETFAITALGRAHLAAQLLEPGECRGVGLLRFGDVLPRMPDRLEALGGGVFGVHRSLSRSSA